MERMTQPRANTACAFNCATVMIPTESRTAFDYVVGPLAVSFMHAFRQK